MQSKNVSHFVHQSLSLEATSFGMKQKFKGDRYLDSLDKALNESRSREHVQ